MTIASRVREAAQRLSEFYVISLFDAVEVRSYREQKAARDALHDLVRRGEVERVQAARYRYIGRKKRITYRQRFWDVARRMVRFSLTDIEQITEAKRDTVKEFCYWMERKGYAERVKRGQFRVIGKLGPIVPKYTKRSDYDESS